jgi:hypothetical protein
LSIVFSKAILNTHLGFIDQNGYEESRAVLELFQKNL